MDYSVNALLEECAKHVKQMENKLLDDEYTNRLSPESFVLELCYGEKKPKIEMSAHYKVTMKPQKKSLGRFEIRDESDLLVASGTMNESGIQGPASAYLDGELIMKAEYMNNKKHGKCLLYRNRVVVFRGEYVQGVRCGQAEETDPHTKRTVRTEYDGFGNKRYEIVNDNGVRRILHLSNGRVDGKGSYRIASQGDSAHYVPEGCYFAKENDKYLMKYYPLSNSVTNPSVPTLRENDDDYLSIISYPTKDGQVIFKGFTESVETPGPNQDDFDPERKLQRCKNGKELFYESVTAADPFLALHCDCTNDKVNGEAQFIDTNCTCVCNGEFEDDVMGEVAMFNSAFDTTFEGLFSDWARPVRVNSSTPLDSLVYTEVSEITISDNLLLKAEALDFSRFVFVKKIVIGKCSFSDVKRAYFWHLPMLESIVVDDGSFCARRSAGNEYLGTVSTLPEADDEKESVLCIGYCNVLKEVKIGVNCFTEYNRLRVEECPRLKSLQVGWIEKAHTTPMNSISFYNAKEFVLDHVHSLETLLLGDYAFLNARQFKLQNMASLREAHFGCNAFFSCPVALFINLPQLTTLEFQDAFVSCKQAVFLHMPAVTSILSSLEQSFLLLQSAEFFNAAPALRSSHTLIRSHVCVVDYAVDYYIDGHHDIHFDCSTEQVSLSDEGDTWTGCTKNGKPYGRGRILRANGREVSTLLVDGKLNGPTVEMEDGREVQSGCYLEGKKEWVTTTRQANGDSFFVAYYHDKALALLLKTTGKALVNATVGSAFHRETSLLCPHPILFSVGDEVSFLLSVVSKNDFLVLGACLKKLVIGGKDEDELDLESDNLVIQDCPNLESFTVMRGCGNNRGKTRQGVVRIHNCPKLTHITFEDKTFVYFSSFLLGDLPSLKKLSIGSLESGEPNNCFQNAEAFTLSSLPSLKTVTIGSYAFANAKSFRIGYANRLEKVEYGKEAFRNCKRVYVNSSSNFRMSSKQSSTSFVDAIVLFNASAGNDAPWINDLKKKVMKKNGYV